MDMARRAITRSRWRGWCRRDYFRSLWTVHHSVSDQRAAARAKGLRHTFDYGCFSCCELHYVPGDRTLDSGTRVWSTWSAVSNRTSRAGELRSAPSGPDDWHRVAGKRALALVGCLFSFFLYTAHTGGSRRGKRIIVVRGKSNAFQKREVGSARGNHRAPARICVVPREIMVDGKIKRTLRTHHTNPRTNRLFKSGRERAR